MGRINKTRYYIGWGIESCKKRELSRSFDTLEAAQKFAEGKDLLDIYKSKGKYKVVWIKTIELDSYGDERKVLT